jgi:hypothetical protein
VQVSGLERSRVALDRRKSIGLMAVIAVLAALLGWAWLDGGERPVSPQYAPAVLPGDAK